MGGTVTNIKAGLQTRLETISGLRVFPQRTDSINEFPAAVILADQLGYNLSFGGTGFEGELRVVLIVEQAITEDAYNNLDDYLAPTGTKSVRAAIYGDSTLGSNVDGVVAVSAVNIGERVFNGVAAVGADFLVRFTKS